MIQNYRDRSPWTESVDSDQTAPEEQSDQGLLYLPFLCKFLTDLGIVKVIYYFHLDNIQIQIFRANAVYKRE